MPRLIDQTAPLALPARKGRGALSNASGRFEVEARDAFDDGWGLDEEPPKLETTLTAEAAKTVITRNTSPDLSFDRTINPYRGCEHGCIYCYARPNHAYVGLSPGRDFESRLFYKADAAALLAQELAAKGYQPDVMVLGGVTDVYQPVEREMKITRALLEVLWAHRHPVALVTKSALVARDLDILGPMAAAGLAKVAVSVTTLDRTFARMMEPRAAAPHRRLDTIRALSAAGVPTTVMTAPIIPSLNDHEIEAILKEAKEAGAVSAGYVMLRLPLEIEDLVGEWLAAHVPDRARRVMKLVREMHGGKAYDARFGHRQRGDGPYAQAIAQRFKKACARLGLNKFTFKLDVSQFRRPAPALSELPLFEAAPLMGESVR